MSTTTPYAPATVTSPPAGDAYVTPPRIAKRLAVNTHKVLGWIHAGRLRAINISDGSQRPRFRVRETDLEIFLASRAVDAAPRTGRRRMSAPANVIEFFS